MKKITEILIIVLVISLSLLTSCKPGSDSKPTYNDNVVKAFNAVAGLEDVVTQTAVASEQKYIVTVITSSAVEEYTVNSEFSVEDSTQITGKARAMTLAMSTQEQSALERAYDEALKLSGIEKSEVLGFDFDIETYMGEKVYQVELEDSVCEYSYILSAADFSLIKSKTEIKDGLVQPSESSYINEATAKAIAFDAVGISEKDAGNLAVRSVIDSGKRIYKVKFDYKGYRYDIDMDAISGDIVKLSKSILNESVSAPEIKDIITEEEAKNVALAFVFPNGADSANVQFRKVKLDYDDGAFVYEVEFAASGSEYEFEISASDGSILDVEIEGDDKDIPQNDKFITREQAIEAVKKVAGDDILILDIEVEKENKGNEKRYFYEVEAMVGGVETEYIVDAMTGKVTPDGLPEANPTPAITEKQALYLALECFELTDAQLTNKEIKLEKEDDGKLCYEIELYVGKTEYSVCIDATTGEAFDKETDVDDDEQEIFPDNLITKEQAIEKIKKVAGENAIIKDIELDDKGEGENKKYFYEVEVVVDGKEYDYYVDAITGEVSLEGEIIGGDSDIIGKQEALEIALAHFDLKEAQVTEIKLDEDDGVLIYEVELVVGIKEYSVEIDAKTGRILESDISYD